MTSITDEDISPEEPLRADLPNVSINDQVEIRMAADRLIMLISDKLPEGLNFVFHTYRTDKPCKVILQSDGKNLIIKRKS